MSGEVLTVGSLFAGIGGFDLGLERAGMRVLWHCESDPYCQRVLARHWPDVPCHPDVRTLTHPPAVDILAGGFPCQDLSYAGKGAGIDGARSGLWAEYARLIRDLRPRYVIVENVSALLARGMGRVLGDLAACGYDAEWDCIPASAVGAPHRRDRVWLVAYPARDAQDRPATQPGAERERARAGGQPGRAVPDADGGGREERGEPDRGPQRPELRASQRDDAGGLHADVADPDGQGSQGHRRPERRPRELAAAPSGVLGDPDPSGRYGRAGQLGPGRRGEPTDPGWWLTEPDVGRVAHGIPNRVDRLRALGNALVPQIAEWIGRRILDYERGAA